MSAKWEILILFNMILLSKSHRRALEPKIYGGKYSGINLFPHSVHMSLYCYEDSMILCGASIVNQRLLLTAAHCLDTCQQYNDWKVDVYAGNEDLVKATIIRKITRFMMHKYFNPHSMTHDIALAYLLHDLPLGNTIKRVIIPSIFPYVTSGHIAGWGTSQEHKDGTPKMKSVPQTIQGIGFCRNYRALKPGMMCAGSGSYSDYPAQGDSGGGFVTNNNILIGVVSFTMYNDPYITIYTNVTYFYGWIASQSRKLACY